MGHLLSVPGLPARSGRGTPPRHPEDSERPLEWRMSPTRPSIQGRWPLAGTPTSTLCWSVTSQRILPSPETTRETHPAGMLSRDECCSSGHHQPRKDAASRFIDKQRSAYEKPVPTPCLHLVVTAHTCSVFSATPMLKQTAID